MTVRLRLCDVQLDRSRSHQSQASRPGFRLGPLSADAEGGESIAVLGANGSGKSTLLRLIAGVLDPTSGERRVLGRIGPLASVRPALSLDLTPGEHLKTLAILTGTSIDADGALAFAELSEEKAAPLRTLSSGQRARVTTSATLFSDADVLLVDESLAVCDAAFRAAAARQLETRRREGALVLMASHNLLLAGKICRRGWVLRNGKLQTDCDIEAAITAALAAPGDGGMVSRLTTRPEVRDGALIGVRLRIETSPPIRQRAPMHQVTVTTLDEYGDRNQTIRLAIPAASHPGLVLHLPVAVPLDRVAAVRVVLADASGCPLSRDEIRGPRLTSRAAAHSPPVVRRA